MKLEINKKLNLSLTNFRFLAIVPQFYNTPLTCCGLNVSMEFDKRKESKKFQQHMIDIFSKKQTVRAYVITSNCRIPVDIHGGNVGECYFGYINPTICE